MCGFYFTGFESDGGLNSDHRPHGLSLVGLLDFHGRICGEVLMKGPPIERGS